MPGDKVQRHSVYVYPGIPDREPLIDVIKSNEFLRRLVEITHGTHKYDRPKANSRYL